MITHPKNGEKQYICGVCAGHAHLTLVQKGLERSASNPRIRILFNWSEKIVQGTKNPAVTKHESTKNPITPEPLTSASRVIAQNFR